MTYRAAVINSGQKFAERLIPCSFRLAGQIYPCRASGFTQNLSLREAGFANMDDGAIILRAELFTGGTRPAATQYCQVQLGANEPWRSLQIVSVSVAPGGQELVLSCNSQASG